MQRIIPHLWYDTEALEAAKLYTGLFEDSQIIQTSIIPDTPSGNAELVDFQLAGVRFSAISAGPLFKFNPSVSLMVACGTSEEVDRLYSQLIVDGQELMPLGEYPFSKRYAWLQDRYGLNWQLFLVENIQEHQRIRPSLLFIDKACGRAEEALAYYAEIFEEASISHVSRYGENEAEDPRAKINYAELNLFGTRIIAMDHGAGGDFNFNEAFSFMVLCKDQEEIDYYWDRLSHVPEAEQCGWVKDRFGLSWQIVPMAMDTMMQGSEEEVKRVTEALLKMKKLDLAALERARLGLAEDPQGQPRSRKALHRHDTL